MVKKNNKQFTIQKTNPKNNLFSVSQNSEIKRNNFVITKKIAKHGNQAIIVVPRILESQLKPGTIVKLNIDVLEEAGGKK